MSEGAPWIRARAEVRDCGRMETGDVHSGAMSALPCVCRRLESFARSFSFKQMICDCGF